MQKKFILFDFDGVIVNSFDVIYGVMSMMCPHVTEEEYKKRFEGNIHDWEEPRSRHTKECRLDLDFSKEYQSKVKNGVSLFPGMRETISKLVTDYTLIIISSTTTDLICEFLESNNLAQYFEAVMGSNVHTSKVEKIKMVFNTYSVQAELCVFVTDTLGDIREAAKMKVGAIAVTWGFHTSETLAKGSPFRLIESPEALLAAVSDYFAQ
jgi:phosphoglycolate phosphatase